MTGSLLISGGRVIDPASGRDAQGDVLVLDGRISAVAPGGALSGPEGTPVFGASGLVVAPGFVDLHTHLREPGFEEKETIATGTLAAARGGFTTVCCMPNTDPAIDSRATVEFVLEQARSQGAVRVLPIAAATRGRDGKRLVEMGELAAAGVAGFSDDGGPIEDAHIMRAALTYTVPLGLPIMDHCEVRTLAAGVMHEGRVSTRLGLQGIPSASEEAMVSRNILLSELTGGHAHMCHLSTAGSVALVREAKARGLKVTAEVTPHHLTLTHDWVAGETGPGLSRPLLEGDALRAYDTNTKVNPPLRDRADVEALIDGLRDGVIDAIATDHAPHCLEDKVCAFDEAAFGISGIETALGSVLSLVHDGRITLPDLVDRLTAGPARVLQRSAPGLGILKAGGPADITVFDPDLEWTVEAARLASKGKNSPLAGTTLKGRPVLTLYGGRIVHDDRLEAAPNAR